MTLVLAAVPQGLAFLGYWYWRDW